jgi:hypothetical protein
VDSLIQGLLPALFLRLPAMPTSAAEARVVVRNSLGGDGFNCVTLHICNSCHYPRGAVPLIASCSRCSTRATKVVDWGEMKIAHRPLAGCIQWLVKDPIFALAMLHHLTEGAVLPDHCAINSPRYRRCREVLKQYSRDPRNLIFALHHDSFCPFENDKDQKSIGYLLVRALMAPAMASHQAFVRVWLCNDGHVKTFQAMLPLLRKDLVECFQEGVVCTWPVAASCVYEGVAYAWKSGESCKIHAVIGCMCADQPAAIVLNGHGHYSSKVACRVCGLFAIGSTVASNIDPLYTKKKGRRKTGSKRKRQGTATSSKTAVPTPRPEPEEPDANDMDDDAPDPAKTTAVHVHWGGFTRDQLFAQATHEPDLDAAILACRAQLGVTQARAKVLASASGFQAASLGLMLHDVSGFDVIRDVIPDWMHEILVLVKQFMHGTYDLLAHVLDCAPKGTTKFCYTHLLLMFRKDIPSPYSRARRIPWGMNHKQLKSWTAEECLVWLRLGWSFFFTELLAFVRGWPVSQLRAEMLSEIGMFQTLWEHMTVLYAAMSHLNGMQGQPADVVELAVNLVDFVANGKLGKTHAYDLHMLQLPCTARCARC